MDENATEVITKAADSIMNVGMPKQLLLVSALFTDNLEDSLFPLRVGINMRERRLYLLSDLIFSSSMQAPGLQDLATWNLALSKAQQGDAHAAIRLFKHIISCPGASDEARINLAIQYARVGENELANKILSDVYLSADKNREELIATYEFCKYINNINEKNACGMYRNLLDKVSSMNVEEIFSKIEHCLNLKIPFSLIRLGDGEGAWLSIDLEDEHSFQSLYKLNRSSFLQEWFDDKNLINNFDFVKLMYEMDAVIADADVVGITDEMRIHVEYQLGSTRGIPSCVNVLRKLLQITSSKPVSFSVCTAMVNLELMMGGFLEKLIAGKRKVGLISCHSELPEIIKQTLQVQEVKFHKIPGEKGRKTIIGYEAAHGQHYPDVFTSITKDISFTEPGMLYLVAAGSLGKLYCNFVKKSGGVAIDIGSVADIWLGKITRPLPAAFYERGKLTPDLSA